jgi:hypothetical protein
MVETTPSARPDRAPLRSRAEQIADEMAAAQLAPEPTVRKLPTHAATVKPRVPGR